ncbi:glycoside hydrolase family 16 protein [Nemania sp. FL0916]|nr:glycoside hydrolase family 16 protein [Nemania sp. FL0916]
MSYSLSTHYAGQALLDSFNFFTDRDPNHGFVDYQSRDQAIAQNLVSVDESNRVKLGVDSINTYFTSDKGRPSVRLTSNEAYTHGLFIADFAHMPSSTCGTWPSFWAFNNENGTSWPTGGEIDIIDGANTAQSNMFSAHTTAGCHAPVTGFAGAQGPTDCSLRPDNVGCNYAAPASDSATYGDAFNAEGGGVYALEWNMQELKIWHFPRSAIPDDIALAPVHTPNPESWGPPHALFGGSTCKADSHFFNMSLVINTNFCGAYAGEIWAADDQCNKLAATCEDFVAGNPNSFHDAFWQINYIDVYEKQKPASIYQVLPMLPSNTTRSRAPSPSAFISTGVIPSRTRTITVTTTTQTMSTAVPTRANNGLADPATVNGMTLLGCFASPTGYESFTRVASSATMNLEACVNGCEGRKYAGVFGETCYCADVLGGATAIANNMCDTACPGNPQQLCGGVLSANETRTAGFVNTGAVPLNGTLSTFPRNGTTSGNLTSLRLQPVNSQTASANTLLTVYGNVKDDIPHSAPAKGGSHPESKGKAKGKTEAVTITNAVTVTYTTICPTDAARLVTLEYCTTLTATKPHGACMAEPTVAMTTCTKTCAACGAHGESTVTLTVPYAVEAGSSTADVVAVTMQTVVPVLAHNSSAHNSTYSGWGKNHATITRTNLVASAAAAPTYPVAQSYPAVPSYPAASSHPGGAAGGYPTNPNYPATTSAVPVAGAQSRTAGFVRTLGYGIALWFVIFGIGMVL